MPTATTMPRCPQFCPCDGKETVYGCVLRCVEKGQPLNGFMACLFEKQISSTVMFVILLLLKYTISWCYVSKLYINA